MLSIVIAPLSTELGVCFLDDHDGLFSRSLRNFSNLRLRRFDIFGHCAKHALHARKAHGIERAPLGILITCMDPAWTMVEGYLNVAEAACCRFVKFN